MAMAGVGDRRRSGRPRKGKEPLGIKAVDQAMLLLKSVGVHPDPQSLMQLSRQSGMEPSKLHRYLVSLCQSGLLAKSEEGLYELGPGSIELGGLALSKLDELTGVDALLTGLMSRWNETSFLYVWTVSGPVMIRSRRPHYSPMTLRIGNVASLIGTATGPVFVAYLPAEVIRPILTRDALAAGVNPGKTALTLFDEIGPRIRAEKIHVSDVTLIPNSSACAAPVFDAQNELLYVIGVSIKRMPPAARKLIAENVRSVAAELSLRIGHRDSPGSAGE